MIRLVAVGLVLSLAGCISTYVDFQSQPTISDETETDQTGSQAASQAARQRQGQEQGQQQRQGGGQAGPQGCPKPVPGTDGYPSR